MMVIWGREGNSRNAVWLFHSAQGFGQLAFQFRARQGDQVSAGDHHNVHACRPRLFVMTENFPDLALGPVACNRIADFPRCNDAQPMMAQTVGQIKKSAEILHSLLAAFGHDFLELGSVQKSFVLAKGLVRHALHGQALASFTAAVGQHPSPAHRGHPGPEAVGALSSEIFRLIGSFHDSSSAGQYFLRNPLFFN
ncbi:hypothetical protein LQ236_000422 [Nitrospina gracilis]|nr:hypothetical protein [Nitrospina sp. Nb-3]